MRTQMMLKITTLAQLDQVGDMAVVLDGGDVAWQLYADGRWNNRWHSTAASSGIGFKPEELEPLLPVRLVYEGRKRRRRKT